MIAEVLHTSLERNHNVVFFRSSHDIFWFFRVKKCEPSFTIRSINLDFMPTLRQFILLLTHQMLHR